MEENIRVLFKPVGQPWETRTIQNSWVDLHDLVEGYIEYVKITDHLALVVNDCGMINGMHLNFVWGPHFIFGPAVMVGIDGPETTSCRLDAEDIDIPRCYSAPVYAVEDPVEEQCPDDNTDLDVDPDDLPGAEEVI